MTLDTWYETVIPVATLATHLHDPSWVVVDCRFDLAAPDAGEAAYLDGHIPGARYAHLDRDLSSRPETDRGRHPLPSPQSMARLFARLGIGDRTQVVAYDDTSGHYAARLWWMLRYMGHRAVAVLDGGWPAWVEAGLPVESDVVTGPIGHFAGRPQRRELVTMDEVPSVALLIDSRDGERYRGEVEPIDPVAGHIPGARNRPYRDNWTADGRWLSPEVLRAQFDAALAGTPASDAVFYCGSGVSACVNLLGMAHAGLAPGRLYVGSWSEWSRYGPGSDSDD